MTLETMMSELHYTNDIEQAILRKIRKDEKLIDKIAETAYHGKDFNLCKRMPLTRYPSCVKSWEENWDVLSTFYEYPPEVRKIIYTTNSCTLPI